MKKNIYESEGNSLCIDAHAFLKLPSIAGALLLFAASRCPTCSRMSTSRRTSISSGIQSIFSIGDLAKKEKVPFKNMFYNNICFVFFSFKYFIYITKISFSILDFFFLFHAQIKVRNAWKELYSIVLPNSLKKYSLKKNFEQLFQIHVIILLLFFI